MSFGANSLAARDIAHIVHPQTNLKRHCEVGPVVLDRGCGVWTFDDDGDQLLDAMSGLWCASLGFAPKRLAEAAYEQMRRMTYGHLYRHNSHEPVISLAEKLLSIAPQSMSKVHFQNSGSEANDVAVKLVWYYQNAIGKPEKRKIISRLGAYHGSSVAAVSLTGKPDMHVDFNLPLEGFLHADCPYYFRDAGEGESEEAYATRLAGNLDDLIEKEGPETIAAFFAEPVLGASGAIPPPRSYFEKIQSVLKKHDVLLVVDEVITGFGRTGSMWGSETYRIEPDIMTCAKALSAGALPISAIMMSGTIYDAMVSQSAKLGNFAHGHTYAGHPVCAAVALETLEIYEEMDLLAHIGRLGSCFADMLHGISDHPLVGNIDLTGLMAGIELMKDKDSGEAFPVNMNMGSTVSETSQRHQLLHRYAGNRIAFAPAYIISEDEIGEIGVRLRKSLDEVHAEVSGN